MKRKFWIVLGGVFIVVVISPLVTLGIWQAQARLVVDALAADATGMVTSVSDSEEALNEPGQLLRIASVGIQMPLRSGSDADALYAGAWHPEGAGEPGAVGNVVIFGHRFLNLPPSKNTMFNLHKVSPGELIEIEWEGETYTYRVTDSKTVAPSQISVLEQTESATLTLITCTPIFTTTNRLVVTAQLVESPHETL